MDSDQVEFSTKIYREGLRLQKCPNCEMLMGDMPGSRDAVCKNCGFKDPCCE